MTIRLFNICDDPRTAEIDTLAFKPECLPARVKVTDDPALILALLAGAWVFKVFYSRDSVPEMVFRDRCSRTADMIVRRPVEDMERFDPLRWRLARIVADRSDKVNEGLPTQALQERWV